MARSRPRLLAVRALGVVRVLEVLGVLGVVGVVGVVDHVTLGQQAVELAPGLDEYADRVASLLVRAGRDDLPDRVTT